MNFNPCRALASLAFVTAAVLAAAGTAHAQAAAAPAALPAVDPLNQALEQLYARYLSGGRSDVEIHLTAAGVRAGARTRSNGDGSYSCHVFGLRPAGGRLDSPRAMLLLAGTLLHEVTHCQVTPYALDVHRDGADPASQAAAGLVLLTLESISDARAVIELARRDGPQAAGEFVGLMLPSRAASRSLGHATAGALHGALQLARDEPQAIAGDADAFSAAVQVGRTSAERAFQRFARRAGLDEAAASPTFQAAVAGLDAALARAVQAFHHGRYENNAATLRLSDEPASAGDYHFFVAPDGRTYVERAQGAEGARGTGALKLRTGAAFRASAVE